MAKGWNTLRQTVPLITKKGLIHPWPVLYEPFGAVWFWRYNKICLAQVCPNTHSKSWSWVMAEKKRHKPIIFYCNISCNSRDTITILLTMQIDLAVPQVRHLLYQRFIFLKISSWRSSLQFANGTSKCLMNLVSDNSGIFVASSSVYQFLGVTLCSALILDLHFRYLI